MLIGALIEGAAYLTYCSIPGAEQGGTAAAIVRLLIERIDAYGLAQPSEGKARSDRNPSDR